MRERIWVHLSVVIPANAGIQGRKGSLVALDPGFRRGDGQRGDAAPRVRSGVVS